MSEQQVEEPQDNDDSEQKSVRKLGNLRLVWNQAIKYPKQIIFAGLALLVAASATLAIPAGFKTIIDKGFAAEGGDVAPYFQILLIIVAVLAIATAFRFYFVSWLGERVVADIRLAVQRNLLRLAPGFFEENRPSEIASRMTSDTAGHRTGRRDHGLCSTSQHRCGHWRNHLPVHACTSFDGRVADRNSGRDIAYRLYWTTTDKCLPV